jgi:hypothetical protein
MDCGDAQIGRLYVPESRTEGSGKVSGVPESPAEGSGKVSGVPESPAEGSGTISGVPKVPLRVRYGFRNVPLQLAPKSVSWLI